MKRIGLIVNPIAGMGGKVGLKGTDGEETLRKAISLGATPRSLERASATIRQIILNKPQVEWVTCAGEMGADLFIDQSIKHQTVEIPERIQRSPAATVHAAKEIVSVGIDLLLFTGGDGTARNIFDAIGEKPVVIGIPSGVKIHSPVFAQSPLKAAELTQQLLNHQIKDFQLNEVIDLDESALRQGIVNTRLYGYLNTPAEPRYLQNKKSSSPGSENAIHTRIAKRIIEEMHPDTNYLIGPGSTTSKVMELLNLEYTLLGVDMIRNKELKGSDLNEAQILEKTQNHPTSLIITPTGGQGYLLGRGNQQISPNVLRQIGVDRLIVIATTHKLASVKDQQLLVDTGDANTDEKISGYHKIITDDIDTVVFKISH